MFNIRFFTLNLMKKYNPHFVHVLIILSNIVTMVCTINVEKIKEIQFHDKGMHEPYLLTFSDPFPSRLYHGLSCIVVYGKRAKLNELIMRPYIIIPILSRGQENTSTLSWVFPKALLLQYFTSYYFVTSIFTATTFLLYNVKLLDP